MAQMDDIEQAGEKQENNENSAPATLPVIGIIYPPPEVRNIVDKTASFVARNGPEFESRIRQNELGNPKFNFLNPGDPYNAYYNHKVKEFKEGRAQEVSLAGTQVQKTVSTTTQLKQQELLKQAQTQEKPFVPKDPPPEYEFIADPPSISALDLDIVKLTAQFVARNGRHFLTALMNKEQRNYQFDFLRPQHSLFQYFTKLLEQYTKILIPPKDLLPHLKEEGWNPKVILNQVKYRADWQRHEEAQRRKEEMIVERERIAYAQIDWHDFVVVETVDYQMGEIGNFPPPTTPEEVGARVLMQDRHASKVSKDNGDKEDEMQIGSDDEMIDKTGHNHNADSSGDENEREMVRKIEETKSREGKDNTQVEDMEEESSSEDEEITTMPAIIDRKQFASTAPALPPMPPTPDMVIVKKNYDPKLAKQLKSSITDELISPLTGTKIPASKVQEHMRIGLLDPRWVEQRDKHIQDKMNQESVYAPGAAIEASLKQLAERRTDIFGVGDEETAIGKKIGEEDIRKDDKITWDGHTSSVEAATRAARANITIEDQIHQIHKVKGLLPDEEKEKIGPKPVSHDSILAKVAASAQNASISKPATIVSKPPLIPTLPSSVTTTQPSLIKPPMPVAPAPTVTAAPPVMPNRQPLPPAPPGILPTPNPPVMLIPAVPQRQFPMMPPGPPVPQNFMPHPSQPLPPMPMMAMKHSMMDKYDDEPLMKKPRTEDSLEPEDRFLAKYQGPVTFKIIMPNIPDKKDWRVFGQMLDITLPLEDPVSVIKAKIHEATNMPPGKQKLNMEGLFLKDSNSLAYYNMTTSTVLQLQVKERGGRKK